MFPSFTGSTRPRRQVNLSGRNSNPFAPSPGSRIVSSPQTSQNALAHAQHERIARQQERLRPPAATKIQKLWRGHRDRKTVQNYWRHEWDREECWSPTDALADQRRNSAKGVSTPAGYDSVSDCLSSLRLLLQFASPHDKDDTQRLCHFAARYLRSSLLPSSTLLDIWIYPLLRLAKLSMQTLSTDQPLPLLSDAVDSLLKLLQSLAVTIPTQLAQYSARYFETLTKVAAAKRTANSELLNGTAVTLLRAKTPRNDLVYEGFVGELLTTPELPTLMGSLDVYTNCIHYDLLEAAISKFLFTSSNAEKMQSKSRESLLWFLAYFIYFRRWTFSKRAQNKNQPDALYVKIVSKLVSFLADDIGSRMDTSTFGSSIRGDTTSSTNLSSKPLPGFVQSEILTLINQENVSSLLANIDVTPNPQDATAVSSDDASAIASYALTLLRAFPRRGDEIRMWLYRGSTSRQAQTAQSRKNLSAIKYFYQAASKTEIFSSITRLPRETVSMLRPEKDRSTSTKTSTSISADSRDQQWRVILLFLELYTFVLKVMDDEEFLSGTLDSDQEWSWTKQSALPLDQVKALTLFLKNLAFSMYWNASEIAGMEATEAKTSLSEYFGSSRLTQKEKSHADNPATFADLSVAGVSGMTLAYLKGMVTGVLRMLYERDSRRKFLPKDHWLMTKYFEMDRFIAAVVSEEEEKHKIEKSYENDGDSSSRIEDDDFDDHDSDGDGRYLIGTQHTQQIRNVQRLQRQQRKTARRKYLESVTPRLEILQNMPFFIPFATRVQIFRQFVSLDQIRRRGTADPDEWRFAVMNSSNGNLIGRHRAKVRRKNVFDDAYAQFYDLGEGLKEPIQIRFVDEFDTIEEGIDGGGVTKEFLTSVTNEAFGASDGMEALFVENDQHLLYPNPAAIDERKATLQQALYREGSSEWNENIRDLSRRYEFLGRIIGKCLYEGILVDIHFAPFFLLKWALTGGSNSASRESNYRANLNDLRDLDEGLYQGLLQLKNYPGNVDDFSLNFEVTDTIRTSPTETKQVTRELRPGGASISVTNENRPLYISYITRHRLQIQPRQQTSDFLRGLGKIVSPSWLSMFNQSELQTLVSGSSSEVSVSDLRANTQYGGLYAIGDDGLEHPSVQLFWKVMEKLDDSDRKKVLKFVTSTPRAPLLGFGNLNPRFSIRDSGSDQTRLPSTSTCVNLLKLPVYRDEKVLKERLLYSVNSGAGFNLS